MASTQLHLNERCRARLPNINFNPYMTEKEVQEEWTKPILVHILASGRLCQDLETFTERQPYSQTNVVTQFLLGTYHHMVILLKPTLSAFDEGLRNYRNVIARHQYLDGKTPSIGDLLELARERLDCLFDAWTCAMETLGLSTDNYTISPGSIVPTASPKELLIRLLVNHPVILKKIAADSNAVIEANIGKHLNLPSAPRINGREFRIGDNIADGSPKMFFICYHTANGNREIYVGANQADWAGLPAIDDIRRADRDYRLEPYIPFATRAFNALQQSEETVILPNSMNSLESKARAYQVRVRAIAMMRDPPHPDFLGRKTEVGQPFDKNMKSQQCCYACQGMMGYEIPAEFKPKAVKSYLCHLDWSKREGYAHSCAEIEVSLQCSKNWMENGEDMKH
ncbi:MAG: hypothetical protein M1839_000584 [Geoglossum umbratile]|nr:MAG: hypothetical protein M1839_000584 [Geoglossum umbratile]